MSPRIVFERPRFSKIAVRVWIGVTIALLLVFLTPGMPDLARVLGGGIGSAIAPLALFLWLRVAQRIELDGEGVTIAGRLLSRRYTWREVAAKRVRFPAYNWNDDEVVMPPALADVEPDLELDEALQYVIFEAGETRYVFRLLDGLLFIRGRDPDGSWPRQAATVFSARDRYALGPSAEIPAARVVPSE